MKKVLQFMVTVGGLLAFATVSAQQQPLISVSYTHLTLPTT